jgi:hypothetical protein
MNAPARIVILSLSVIGLAACAGMQQRSGAAYVAPQRAPSIMDDDDAYIAKVEAIARQRGLDVVWVNKPRKAPARSAADH